MKIRCVYQIRNVLNGRHYIGSTENFAQRKRRHFYDLEKGVHRSRFMQRDFIKCGMAAFDIYILEKVEAHEDLISREQYWIDTTSPNYNSAKIAGTVLGVKHSAESVRKNSERNRGFGNGNARISKDHADEIQKLMSSMTVEQIAYRYGVARTTIQRLFRRLGVNKVNRLYDKSARAMFSLNATENIAGKNALPVFVLRRGDVQQASLPSVTAAAKLLNIDVSSIAKRLKRSSISFCGDFCVSRDPIDAAMVAWPYRTAANGKRGRHAR